MTIPTCVSCKWCEHSKVSSESKDLYDCVNPKLNKVDVVTGEVRASACEMQRVSSSWRIRRCGYEGLYWEAKS